MQGDNYRASLLRDLHSQEEFKWRNLGRLGSGCQSIWHMQGYQHTLCTTIIPTPPPQQRVQLIWKAGLGGQGSFGQCISRCSLLKQTDKLKWSRAEALHVTNHQSTHMHRMRECIWTDSVYIGSLTNTNGQIFTLSGIVVLSFYYSNPPPNVSRQYSAV